jgi:Flp pilus assembly protein TadG
MSAHRRLVFLDRLARDRGGVTAIEFAMLLPFFVMLLFGIIQFGQALFLQMALQHAVTAAARCASNFATSLCTSTSTTAQIASQAALGINVSTSVFNACFAQSTCAYNNTSAVMSSTSSYNCVTAGYPLQIGVPFVYLQTVVLTAASCYPVS